MKVMTVSKALALVLCLQVVGFLGVTSIYAQKAEGRWLTAITSQAEFDSLARVYKDANYPLPHVIFVIDRKDNNKIYYVNTQRYPFHRDFVNGTYLSLERGQEFTENNYLKPNRRFIMGTLAYQTPVKRWTFEFWEGDLIPADLIKLTSEIVNKTFFEKVAFKPNSLRQEEVSESIKGLKRILQADIAKEQEYMPLNIAKGLGRVHIIEKLDDTVDIGFNEIIVLNEVPISLPPVSGIIINKPSTPLSHINLLAKGWGVPNAYIKNAQELFKQYDGWWVEFETKQDGYTIKRADLDQLKEYQKRLLERKDIMTPKVDLQETRILSIGQQRARDIIAYGAKSANLGELLNARLEGVTVPNGFTIPFYYYDEFLKENNFEEVIFELLNDQNFIHNPSYRKQKLVELRDRIQKGTVNDELREQVLTRIRKEFPGKGMFVRSSTNGEDLPNFSGAGLYTSVPNVRDEKAIIEAIKTVWASVWNFQAYEARERAGVDHTKILPAVLIQEGINADSAGVLITTDPFNRDNKGSIYISAKRGLGMKVVEGTKVAEQILYNPKTDSIKVLTRSAEDSLLTFDKKGGVKEVRITGNRAVLTDVFVRRLVRAAEQIKNLFENKDQDIEWLYLGGKLYIVQSRPFVTAEPSPPVKN